MITEFTLDDLFSALRDFTKYQPVKKDTCKRVNTFAVLEKVSDVNETNLAITSDKLNTNEYYSINKGGFPALIIRPSNGQIREIGVSNRHQKCNTFELGIADNLIVNCTNCSPCEKRTLEDIYADTEQLLINTLDYLFGIKRYEVLYPNNDTDSIWEHDDIITQKLAEGDLTSADLNRKATTSYIRMLRENNQIQINRWRYKTSNIYGVFILFTVCHHICFDAEVKYRNNILSSQNC